jgi:hypothetical protein
VRFRKSWTCAALYEFANVTVTNSEFAINQCFPQGNALPLAILTTSLVTDLAVSDTIFFNNTALTGAVFLMNVSATVTNVTFASNHAVQGAALSGSGSNLTVGKSNFSENSAMAIGGAVSLAEGNAVFESCDFVGNQAPEGAAISLKSFGNFSHLHGSVKRNNGTNATYINAEGENLSVTLSDIEIDDEFEKAVFLDPLGRADFGDARFGCKLRCRTVGSLAARAAVKPVSTETSEPDRRGEGDDQPEEEPEPEPEPQQSSLLIWAFIPIVLVIVAVVYRVVGLTRMKKFFQRALRVKGRHTL